MCVHTCEFATQYIYLFGYTKLTLKIRMSRDKKNTINIHRSLHIRITNKKIERI